MKRGWTRPGPQISDLRFTPAPRDDQARGLLGWVSLVLDGGLCIDGIALRRTRDGRRALSFPVRHDRSGRQHSLIRPVNAAARRAIEAAVFEALDLDRPQELQHDHTPSDPEDPDERRTASP